MFFDVILITPFAEWFPLYLPTPARLYIFTLRLLVLGKKQPIQVCN